MKRVRKGRRARWAPRPSRRTRASRPGRPQGELGPQGPQGEMGLQGPPGEPGATGPARAARRDRSNGRAWTGRPARARRARLGQRARRDADRPTRTARCARCSPARLDPQAQQAPRAPPDRDWSPGLICGCLPAPQLPQVSPELGPPRSATATSVGKTNLLMWTFTKRTSRRDFSLKELARPIRSFGTSGRRFRSNNRGQSTQEAYPPKRRRIWLVLHGTENHHPGL